MMVMYISDIEQCTYIKDYYSMYQNYQEMYLNYCHIKKDTKVLEIDPFQIYLAIACYCSEDQALITLAYESQPYLKLQNLDFNIEDIIDHSIVNILNTMEISSRSKASPQN